MEEGLLTVNVLHVCFQHSAASLKELLRVLHLLSLVLSSARLYFSASAHCIASVLKHVNMGLWVSSGTLITHHLHVCSA